MTLENLHRLLFLCYKVRTAYSDNIDIDDKWEILEELGIEEADAETIHKKMDELLLNYINNPEITLLFNSTHKYYV